MTEAEEYIQKEYKISEKKSLTELDISNHSLTGISDLSDFVNLEKLNCSFNQLTGINVKNNKKLKELHCKNNLLTSLDLRNCEELKVLEAQNYEKDGYKSFNKLSDISFLSKLPNPEKLEILCLCGNKIRSDLSPFDKLINLKKLDLGAGGSFTESFMNEKSNRFYGSLKPLQNLVKLKELDISNTDVDRGLEYLPESIEKIYCEAGKSPDSLCQHIQKQLEPYQKGGYYDYQTWRRNNKELIEDIKEPLEKLEERIKELREQESELIQKLRQKRLWWALKSEVTDEELSKNKELLEIREKLGRKNIAYSSILYEKLEDSLKLQISLENKTDTDLSEEVKNLTEKIKQKEDEINYLQSEIFQKEEEIKEKLGLDTNLSKKIENLTQNLEEKKKEITDLKSEISRKENEIENKIKDKNKIEKELKTTRSQLETKEQKLNELEKEIEGLRMQLERKKNQLTKKGEELDKLKEKNTKLIKQCEYYLQLIRDFREKQRKLNNIRQSYLGTKLTEEKWNEISNLQAEFITLDNQLESVIKKQLIFGQDKHQKLLERQYQGQGRPEIVDSYRPVIAELTNESTKDKKNKQIRRLEEQLNDKKVELGKMKGIIETQKDEIERMNKTIDKAISTPQVQNIQHTVIGSQSINTYQIQYNVQYQQLETDVEKQINASLTDKEITPQEQKIINKTILFLGTKELFINHRQATINNLIDCYNKLEKRLGNKLNKFTNAVSMTNMASKLASIIPGGGVAEAPIGLVGDTINLTGTIIQGKDLAKFTKQYQEILDKDKKNLSLFDSNYLSLINAVWEDNKASQGEIISTIIEVLDLKKTELSPFSNDHDAFSQSISGTWQGRSSLPLEEMKSSIEAMINNFQELKQKLQDQKEQLSKQDWFKVIETKTDLLKEQPQSLIQIPPK